MGLGAEEGEVSVGFGRSGDRGHRGSPDAIRGDLESELPRLEPSFHRSARLELLIRFGSPAPSNPCITGAGHKDSFFLVSTRVR